jgi:hypothetical protein
VIPTVWAPRAGEPPPPSPSGEWVVKPTVSAGSRDTALNARFLRAADRFAAGRGGAAWTHTGFRERDDGLAGRIGA